MCTYIYIYIHNPTLDGVLDGGEEAAALVARDVPRRLGSCFIIVCYTIASSCIV